MHYRAKVLLSLGVSVACVGCSWFQSIHGPFPNFVPVIDSPTPDERQLAARYFALYPDGVDADGGDVLLDAGTVVVVGGLDGGVDGGVVYDSKRIRYPMRDGWAYCRNIEQHAARTSNAWAAEGIVFLGAGLAGSVAGTKMMTEGKATFEDFATLGGSLVALGIGIFGLERSSSAAKASSTASLGMASQSSDAAFAICMAARSQWISDRQEANTQARLMMIKYAEGAFKSSAATDAGPGDAGADDAGSGTGDSADAAAGDAGTGNSGRADAGVADAGTR
ncbi:hypothetical protein [Myxococcus qinghaiensis]|uniref:hypothetical protein n=1 Tax=Myxococcus qinghaiensis TaxID=2906758 RepID=UPI0020A71188|nr:hypothetical protein [Myxococcus qinghaiensis]MCP3164097.1 hypothetical protein [Myxococcus qinghaiensis]